MNKTVLVVAAHPDDEVIGMGGTIARHAENHDKIHVLYLSDGVGARGGGNDVQVQKRRSCALGALAVLGANSAGFKDFPDNEFDSVPLLRIVQAIETVKASFVPDIVYTHHGGDLNIDHQVTCQAVLTAFRPQPMEACREIMSFEVCSSTEWAYSRTDPFLPDTFVDISDYLTRLEEACRCYGAEFRDDPHARSVEAILTNVQNRGRSVGVNAAEAFVTLRRVIR